MIGIIIGNICSLLGMVIDSLSSTRKRAKDVLYLQALSQLAYCISSAALKGYSAAVQSAVSVVRNLAATRKEVSKAVEWGFVSAGVILGLWFNNRGLFGLLPVISNLEYSLAVFRFKDNERALKIAFAVSIVFYVVFNASILNFVGVISNMIVLGVTIGNLAKMEK